ncbi:MAG: M56 family metallopeptidase [Gammaproteobacteria bacterium]
MIEFSTFAVSWLLTYLVHSTLLLGAVFLIERFGRIRSGALLAGLWRAVLFGAIVTASLQTLFATSPLHGRLPIAPAHTPPAVAAAPQPANFDVKVGHPKAKAVGPAQVTAKPTISRPKFTVSKSTKKAQPASGSQVSSLADLPAQPGRYWPFAVLAIWLAIALVLLVRLASCALAARRELSGRTRLLAGPAYDALSALCRDAGRRRRPRLSVSASIAGPVSLANGEICLPSWALERLAPNQIRAMLAHELAHYRRRDPQWQFAASLVKSVLFFQPLNRLASARLAASAELACDDWAAVRTGDRRALAECLAECATRLHASKLPIFASAMASPDSALTRRVGRLMGAIHLFNGEITMKTRIIIIIALAALAFLAPGFLIAPSRAATSVPPSASLARAQSMYKRAVRRAEVAQKQAQAAALELQQAQRKAGQKQMQKAESMRMRAAHQAEVAQKQVRAAALERRQAQREAHEQHARSIHGSSSLGGCTVTNDRDHTTLTAGGSAGAGSPSCAGFESQGYAISVAQDGRNTSVSISGNGRRLKMHAHGLFAFNAAENGVVTLANGSELEIEAIQNGTTRRAVFSGTNGAIERSYYVNGKAQPFDANAHKWLARVVPQILRESAINVKARIAHIFKRGGPDAVLAEIAKIRGGYARSIYISTFAQSGPLNPAIVDRLIAEAAGIDSAYGKEHALAAIYKTQHPHGSQLTALLKAGSGMDSGYQTSQLLQLVAAKMPLDNTTVHTYLEMAGKIDSDYEMRTSLSALLQRPDVTPSITMQVIAMAAKHLSSAYALQTTLGIAASRLGNSSKAVMTYCRAASHISSSYGKRQALDTLLQKTKLKKSGYMCVLNATASVSSDYDRATLLVKIAHQMPNDSALLEKYRSITKTIGSAYDREQAEDALPN